MGKKKLKCKNCKSRKKVKLFQFTCKCCKKGEVFCLNCHYPHIHNCEYDCSEDVKKKLTKENPVIEFDKLLKL